MKLIKITDVRTPSGFRLGYQEHVGKTLKYTGNAYNGFELILEDGSKIPLQHFNYTFVEV